MNNICIIIVYFGKFNKNIDIFFESCKRNSSIDWLVFTDNEYTDEKNIRFIKSTLDDINYLIKENIGKEYSVFTPYKLCDLRPLYGTLFFDYIKNYDYWGYCDTDVVCGNIAKYLEKINFSRYDKINSTGHFSIIRNTEICNSAFSREVKGTINYKKILLDKNINYGFDERDFNKKFLSIGLKVYTGIFAADIDVFYKRMRCVDKQTAKYLSGFTFSRNYPTNYSKQIFLSVDGEIKRYYIKRNKVFYDNFAYIHYRWTESCETSHPSNSSFIISRKGFFDFDKSSLNDYKNIENLIFKYNTYENKYIERLRFIYFWIKKYLNK